MIESYYQLTGKLIHDYVGSLHETTFKENLTVNDSHLTQYHIYQDDERKIVLMVINVTNVQDKIQLINLVDCCKESDDDGKVDTILLDWNKFETDNKLQIKFPIDEINLSADVITAFNEIVNKNLNGKKLEQLFKVHIKSPRQDLESIEKEIPQIPTSKIPRIDPAASRPDKSIPDKPGFEDEYEMQSSNHANQFNPPMGPPPDANIGDADLYPGGIKDPTVKGYMDPLRAPLNNEGMYPSRDHPLFNRDRLMGGPDNSPMGARYDDPLSGDSSNMDLIGDGLPGFRKSSGGPGNPGFPGMGGNHHPFGGL